MAPEFLAPEEFGMASYRPTRKSDIYSCGCVCIEVIQQNLVILLRKYSHNLQVYTGRSPWPEITNYAQVIVPVLKGKRPSRPVAATGGVMTDELWHIVQDCWSKDAAARPSAAELVKRIQVPGVHPSWALAGIHEGWGYHCDSGWGSSTVPPLHQIR